MASKKRRGIIYGGLAVLVAVIALAGWGTVELLRPNHPYTHSWQADASGRKLLEVHTDGMGVSLSPGDSSHLEVKATGGYDDGAPQVSVKPSGQGLSVVGTCPGGGCSVQLHIKLPADLAVKADTGGPAISASDLKGRLDLRTGSGAIDVDNASGPLNLHTGDGAVTLADSRSARASVTTGAGAVDAGFVSAPTDVNIATGDGAVDLRVPHGSRYYIDATSSDSTPDVQLPVDRNAPHQITVKTHSGGIQVH
ncbi:MULTISPECIES: DUF4097 family beta strand repeat-containing protein [Streptomyces]|uniref:DUF4097 family beta strand repeat-containing protein n=1 Tax=Streptomyces TaxID=1883 RepID=UPI0004CDA91E|nr:DUF4097 family beta strand repeat-containing protein [Streptomyces durhamensis]